jgi:hypothetical protein
MALSVRTYNTLESAFARASTVACVTAHWSVQLSVPFMKLNEQTSTGWKDPSHAVHLQ